MSQTALITGASRGIGRAIAIALAHRGYRVACLGRSHENLMHTVRACEAMDGTAMAVVADLEETAQLERGVAEVHGRFGPIGVLVNNAGIGAWGRIQEVDIDEIERAVQINLMATIRLTALASRDMVREGGGAIINIASIAGKLTMGRSSGYAASKHGVVGFTGSIFEDLRESGVKVCVICPGYVNTDMTHHLDHVDPRRMIQPNDIADAVLYVLESSPHVCPCEITLRPQRSPHLK